METLLDTLLTKKWVKTSNNYLLSIGRYSQGNWMGRINPKADDILTGTPSNFCHKDVFSQDGFGTDLQAAQAVLREFSLYIDKQPIY